MIWINGAKAGEHKGGYASFELDVTALVTNGENTVVVYAQDDNRSGIQPCGKQARLYYSNGCDDTRTTGIWQTVWLEFTPREALTYIRITPDVASEAALLDIETVGGHAVEAVASYNGCEVGRACVPLTGGRAHLELRLAQLHLWELGKPELYDLTVSLDTGDTVRSYFGMRSVSLSDTALLLNGRPVFMRTVKDQGFNPGGVDPICPEVFYAVTKEMDRTRPVIDASGGVHFKTDMYDVHDYEQDPAKLKERFDKMLDDPSFVAFGIATDDDKYLTQQYDLFVDSAFIGKRVFSCLIMIFVC